MRAVRRLNGFKLNFRFALLLRKARCEKFAIANLYVDRGA